jgi:hypothetical protein
MIPISTSTAISRYVNARFLRKNVQRECILIL